LGLGWSSPAWLSAAVVVRRSRSRGHLTRREAHRGAGRLGGWRHRYPVGAIRGGRSFSSGRAMKRRRSLCRAAHRVGCRHRGARRSDHRGPRGQRPSRSRLATACGHSVLCIRRHSRRRSRADGGDVSGQTGAAPAGGSRAADRRVHAGGTEPAGRRDGARPEPSRPRGCTPVAAAPVRLGDTIT
jgi:hypothetical protein